MKGNRLAYRWANFVGCRSHERLELSFANLFDAGFEVGLSVTSFGRKILKFKRNCSTFQLVMMINRRG